MPWKFGDELNEVISMPIKVLGGRLRKMMVGAGAMDMKVGNFSQLRPLLLAQTLDDHSQSQLKYRKSRNKYMAEKAT